MSNLSDAEKIEELRKRRRHLEQAALAFAAPAPILVTCRGVSLTIPDGALLDQVRTRALTVIQNRIDALDAILAGMDVDAAT
jgi:hypothetical protein